MGDDLQERRTVGRKNWVLTGECEGLDGLESKFWDDPKKKNPMPIRWSDRRIVSMLETNLSS